MSSAAAGAGSLPTVDLVVGKTYAGDGSGQLKDEPLSQLLGVGNMGGIRQRGPTSSPELIVLYSTLVHPQWTDEVDTKSGVVTYHGDNVRPGPLLATKGNVLLRMIFERGFATAGDRAQLPPIFVFTAPTTGGHSGRTVEFVGLAVPGAVTRPEEDWLVAKWFGTTSRFENYVVTLTLLDAPTVTRAWLEGLPSQKLGPDCPTAFRHWVDTGQRRSRGTVG